MSQQKSGQTLFGLTEPSKYDNPTKLTPCSRLTQPDPTQCNNTITTAQKRFALPPKRDYNQQYFNVYRSRLEACQEFFKKQIKTILEDEFESNGNALAEDTPIWDNLPDAKPGQKCVIIGVSYKTMDKKPSVLDDVGYQHQKQDNSLWRLSTSNNANIFPTTSNSNPNDNPGFINIVNERNYSTDTDVIHLEDVNGRIPLIFTSESTLYTHHNSDLLEASSSSYNNNNNTNQKTPATPHYFVSGMIMACEGELLEGSGEFQVKRIFLPTLHFEQSASPSGDVMIPCNNNDFNLMIDDDDDITSSLPPKTLEIDLPVSLPTDTYIAMVSGINLASLQGPSYEQNKISLTLINQLSEFLTSNLTSDENEINSISRNITHCIIAGDLIGNTPATATLPVVQKGKKPIVTYTSEKQLTQLPTLRHADILLTKLASAMNVHLLPGIHDPTNFTLPQQPFNPCLFPSASTYKTFNCVTNPSQVQIGEIDLIGTDGASIVNITKYSHHSILSALSLTLQAQHLAPTAPDTIGLYPYQDQDPLAFCPDKTNIKTATRFKQPDVIFAGNAPHFQTARFKTATVASMNKKALDTNANYVDIVCVPNFSTTGSFVLFNTRTRQFIPIYLGTEPIVNSLDNIQTMFTRMNMGVAGDEHHAAIEFGDDDEPGEGGE